MYTGDKHTRSSRQPNIIVGFKEKTSSDQVKALFDGFKVDFKVLTIEYDSDLEIALVCLDPVESKTEKDAIKFLLKSSIVSFAEIESIFKLYELAQN